jgi:hypothetical protein
VDGNARDASGGFAPAQQELDRDVVFWWKGDARGESLVSASR